MPLAPSENGTHGRSVEPARSTNASLYLYCTYAFLMYSSVEEIAEEYWKSVVRFIDHLSLNLWSTPR